jgi:zinc transport system permease protein
MKEMVEAIQFEFFRNAAVAGLLASLLCGVIGTLVVVNRLVFLSGGIAHSAYGGIGLAFFFGIPYLAGTLGFTLTAALIMSLITVNARHRSDTVIGVIWAVGMALGIIFIDLTPGYNVDLMSYLFGSILTVSRWDLYQMVAISTVVILAVGYYYHDLLAMSYDEEFARLRGVPVRILYPLLLCLIALSIVLIIRIVGLILVMALFTIPPYIAEKYSGSLLTMMLISIIFGAFFSLSGLAFSYVFNLTSGATIIIVAALGFFASILVDRVMRKGES